MGENVMCNKPKEDKTKITIKKQCYFEPKDGNDIKYALRRVSFEEFKASLEDKGYIYEDIDHIKYHHNFIDNIPNMIMSGSSMIDLYHSNLLNSFGVEMSGMTGKIPKKIFNSCFIDAESYSKSALSLSIVNKTKPQPVSDTGNVAALPHGATTKITVNFEFEKAAYPEKLDVSIEKSETATVANGIVNLSSYFKTENFSHMSLQVKRAYVEVPGKYWGTNTFYSKYNINVNDTIYKDLQNDKRNPRPVCTIGQDTLSVDCSHLFSKADANHATLMKNGINIELTLWTKYSRPYTLSTRLYKDRLEFDSTQLTEIVGK